MRQVTANIGVRNGLTPMFRLIVQRFGFILTVVAVLATSTGLGARFRGPRRTFRVVTRLATRLALVQEMTGETTLPGFLRGPTGGGRLEFGARGPA